MNMKRWAIYLASICLAAHMGCARGIKTDDLNEQPVPVETMLSKALSDLGLMTEIYGSIPLKIQSVPLVDQTDEEWKKGGDNSRTITEKIKTAVSSIGGKVQYIPYDPVFAHVQMVKYDTDTEKRLLPDVVLEGTIIDFYAGQTTKGGEDSRAHLIFNLIDFHSLASIARVRTENRMYVKKSKEKNKVHILLNGPLYQKEGDIEKIKDSSQAVQMAVELSMIQIIGKHLALPYWKLLDGASVDPDVLDSLKHIYYQMDEPARISRIQELLFLHGYDVAPTGSLNMETKIALQDYENTETLFHRPVDQKLFLKLYFSLPITDETLERRYSLDRMRNPS